MQKVHMKKSQHMIRIRTLRKLAMEGNFLNRIKYIYEKSIANTILKDIRLKPFPLRSETKQECLFPPLLSNIALKGLARATRQEKEIQGIWIGKEEVKLSLFMNSMILYVENPPKKHKKVTRTTNKQIQQSCRVQDKHTEVSTVSISLKWTIWKWNLENNSIYNNI